MTLQTKHSSTVVEAKLRMDEALVHIQSGDYNKALLLYNQALELNPNNKNILIARSKCYLLLGEPYNALQDTEIALKGKLKDSSKAKAIYYKAEALYYLEDYEMSLVHYYRGMRVRPEFTQFRLGVQKAKDAIENSMGSKRQS